MAKVTPVLWKHKSDSAGRSPIYLRIHHGEATKYKSLGVRLKPTHWNARQRRVRKSHKRHGEINALIQQQLSRASAAILDMKREGQRLTAEAVKEVLSDDYAEGPDVIVYAEKVIRRFRRRGQIATAADYSSRLNKLKCFAGSKLPFERLTPSFLHNYADWMAEERDNRQTTVAVALSFVRSVANKAVEEGLIEAGDNPFLSFSIERGTPRREQLSLQDVQALEELPLDGALLHTKNIFLFALYAAGMRSSDVLLLRHENVRNGRVEYTMRKTDEPKSIKLALPAQRILDYYRPGEAKELVFPFLKGYRLDTPEQVLAALASRNARLNELLKVIADRAGLSIQLKFHHARHSFASIAQRKGWDVAEISRALGHSSLSVTEQYLAGFSDQDLDDKMEGLFGGGSDDE